MTADTITQAVAAQYTGADPTGLAAELRAIIEASITNDPRSLQTRIGPSGLGNPCDRCLTLSLAEVPQRAEAAWLPASGRAIHDWLESVFLNHEATRQALGLGGRFLPECKVNAGPVNEVDITGSTDVFDTHTGTVVDWKYVGTTTLKQAKAHGASPTYQRQAHLYGKGWEDAGYTVKSVLIYYLPRNGMTLADGYAWQEPYERRIALDALARAEKIATNIKSLGLDIVLADTPEHTGQEFSCKSYGYQPNLLTKDPGDPFG